MRLVPENMRHLFLGPYECSYLLTGRIMAILAVLMRVRSACQIDCSVLHPRRAVQFSFKFTMHINPDPIYVVIVQYSIRACKIRWVIMMGWDMTVLIHDTLRHTWHYPLTLKNEITNCNNIFLSNWYWMWWYLVWSWKHWDLINDKLFRKEYNLKQT